MAHKNRPLSQDELQHFGAELDALRARTLAQLGAPDARYIRGAVSAVRWTGALGRILLFVGAFVPMLLWPACIAGTLLLALSKILENMTVGHNVIHGQYDWMGDRQLHSRSYEWDIVATSENWRRTHNFRHHTYTNVRGLDDDIGYGLLRIFPEQKWRPFYLLQPPIAVVFCLLFEWGVAIQDLRLGRFFAGKMSFRQLRAQLSPLGRKIGRQMLKDYVIFPALAGPFFLPVLLGNITANVLRSIWTYVVIFCGHFTAEAETFPKDVVRNESRGHWYLRQLRGSSNISGGRVIDVLTGDLSHQIEHHFFPDIPANRYADMAVEVRQICRRYGQHYNTGSLFRQFGQVAWRIVRHAFPSKPRRQAALTRKPAAARELGANQAAQQVG